MGASGVGRLSDGGISDGGRPLGIERQDVEGDGDVDNEAIVLDLRKGDPSVDVNLIGGNATANGAVLPRPSGVDFTANGSAAPAEVPSIGVVPVGPYPGLLGATSLQRGIKRAIDIWVGVLGLVVLIPFIAAVAVAIKASSPGPVLYRSRRVGRDGEVFEFWKFRSMYAGAEGDRSTVAHLNEATGPVFKISDDPRITPVGRFLRRSSLDELPQLAHVVSGRMSLVGPRPPLPDEVATYDVTARRRLAVRPGLTCIWQTSGRSDIEFDAWVQMDIDYIETWSLGKDLTLIARTIPAVLGGRGAY